MNAVRLFERYTGATLDSLTHAEDNDGTTTPVNAIGNRLERVLYAAAKVPVYALHCAKALEESSASDPTITVFHRLPLLTKQDLDPAGALGRRCVGGTVDGLDVVHVSSGSGGTPTFWGRSVAEELLVATRFEAVFKDAFNADVLSTLAIVALPMGSWVGGYFTSCCMRYLSLRGYRITVVTPGNNPAEILRMVTSLGPSFNQTVILGYPPFVKTVIDIGVGAKVPWAQFNMRFVLAGEVFSEEWRSLIAKRACVRDELESIASIYGTADAAVLATETRLSAGLRKLLSSRPEAMRRLFGKDRLPSFMQYDPLARFFETADNSEDGSKMLVLTTMPPDVGEVHMPLVRYCIGDSGNVMGFDELLEFVTSELFADQFKTAQDLLQFASGGKHYRKLPFVWVFGRAFWTVSLYGANVYVENIMVGLEHESAQRIVTGKFVLAVNEDNENVRLVVRVEKVQNLNLADSEVERIVGDSILTELNRLNSEFANYVPRENQRPIVEVFPFGHEKYFPVGVKHSYII